MTLAATTAQRKRRDRPREVPRGSDLLAWYDRHRRKLPWRAGPGETPDPYRVWRSGSMLQQTTVTAVAPHVARFPGRSRGVNAPGRAPLDHVPPPWAARRAFPPARHRDAGAGVV